MILCVVVTACSKGENVGAPAEPEPYLSAVLSAPDVSRARAVQAQPAAADAVRRCLGAVAALTRSGTIETESYQIEQAVDVFASDSDARKAISRYDDSKRVAACIAEHLRPLILVAISGGDSDTAKGRIGRELMTRHPSPKIGDRSMSMRVSIPIDEEGWNAQRCFYADVVAARNGPAVAMLVAVNAPGSDRFELEDYLRTVVVRMP